MRGSNVQNSAVMDSQVLNGAENDMASVYSVHGGILFTQAAIVLLVGLLLPIPPIAIDVLLAINLVFTAMLLFVVLFAREPADITSVPLVVIFVTLLRLGTNVAAAKSILLIANGGRIINWFGTHIYYGFISIVIAVILVLLTAVLICKAANFIRFKAVNYLTEIIPSRRTTLQAEFQTGMITHSQMLRAKNRIEKQIKFFAGMASTSSLLLCDAVIVLIITSATIFGAVALAIMNASASMVNSQQYAPQALAIAMTTAVPAALVAFALRLLINRRFLITLKVQTPIPQTIHVASRFVTPALDADTAIAAAIPDPVPEIASPPEEKDMATITEFTDQTQTPVQEATDTAAADVAAEQAPPPQIVRDDYYYDSILATIGDKPRAAILLAGQNISQLPVTVAVEVVVRIIKLKKKCLLIDMDPSRNAIAMAFDINYTSMQGKAVPTGIENLWVSPADDPANPAAVKLARKIKNALKVFNYVVIYAPNAAEENVRPQLAGVSDAAVIFRADEKLAAFEQLVESLSSSPCRVIFEYDLCKKNA